MPRKNIVIVIGMMMKGGAHRVASLQANYLSRIGHKVTLLCIHNSNDLPYLIEENVNIVYAVPNDNLPLNSLRSSVKRKLLAIPFLCRMLSTLKPDVVISHIQGTNAEAILACKMLGIPIICSEHTNYFLPERGLRRLFALFERHFIYKLADHITVLTNYDYINHYNGFLKKCSVIRNPSTFEISDQINKTRTNTLLVVGEIDRVHIKGWDNLLYIFSIIVGTYPDLKLKFVGGGDIGTKKLKLMAQNLSIEKSIIFYGPSNNVAKHMDECDIFILPSRYEGMPMALIEALSRGCAIAAYDCITGPSDIIEHEISGILVKNQCKSEMISTILRLIDDPELRSRLGRNAILRARYFEQDVVLSEWELLISKVLQNRNE